MKKKLLLLIVLALFIVFTLFPINLLNADPLGTTLSVSKDAIGSSIGYITWSVEKTVDRDSVDLAAGEIATVNYTVTAIPTYHESEVAVSGNINILNTGAETANITYVYDRIEYTVDGSSWIELAPEVIMSTPFTIVSGGSSDIPYIVSFVPVDEAIAFRNTVLVGLENCALSGGGVGFNEYTYTTDFTIPGGTAYNPFADVSDSLMGYLGETWVGDPDTYTYTYSQIIGPYATPGDYTVDNTATIIGTELPMPDSDSVTVSVHVEGILKGYKLINSGVPGKGLETAPGQQKPFNPKSQASEHAGKKK